jgi:hypothetical protein
MENNEVIKFKNEEFKEHCSDYTFIPFIYPKVDRIIVFGDIHGDYNMIIKLLQMAKLAKIVKENKVSRTRTMTKTKKINKKNKKRRQSRDISYDIDISVTETISSDEIEYEMEWIGGNTHLVQVGDQIDRCRPNGSYTCDNPKTINPEEDEDSDIKILKLFTNLHEQAVKDGGAVISLFGNHELLNALGEVQYVSFKGLKNILKKYKINGKEFDDGADARRHAFKPGNEFGKFLGCTRVATVIIGSNLFVHAGIIDTLVNELKFTGYLDVEHVNILIKKWLLGLIQTNKINNLIRSQDSMFWTRVLGSIPHGVPIDYPACQDNISKVLKLFNIDRMIIGHTPQSFLLNKDINGTCGNTIWRVDNGSSNAFDSFDKSYQENKQRHYNRRYQYLEILNDNEYHVYDENGRVF